MLSVMRHLRPVTDADSGVSVPVGPRNGGRARPMVSLRLLMAASGRCSCDGCLLAYRAGDKSAGIVSVRAQPAISAVR